MKRFSALVILAYMAGVVVFLIQANNNMVVIGAQLSKVLGPSELRLFLFKN